jgi:hypothetical protein
MFIFGLAAYAGGRPSVGMRAERSRDGGSSHLDVSPLRNLVVATLKPGEFILC